MTTINRAYERDQSSDIVNVSYDREPDPYTGANTPAPEPANVNPDEYDNSSKLSPVALRELPGELAAGIGEAIDGEISTLVYVAITSTDAALLLAERGAVSLDNQNPNMVRIATTFGSFRVPGLDSAGYIHPEQLRPLKAPNGAIWGLTVDDDGALSTELLVPAPQPEPTPEPEPDPLPDPETQQ